MATRTAQERAAEIARIKAESAARKTRVAERRSAVPAPTATAAPAAEPAPAPTPSLVYFEDVGFEQAAARAGKPFEPVVQENVPAKPKDVPGATWVFEGGSWVLKSATKTPFVRTATGGLTPEEPEAAGFAIVRNRLTEYGLEGLESALKKIRNDYPELPSDDIMFLLENDERYNAPFKKRFRANDARVAKGLPRLSAAEYLNMEKGYKKLFTTYNLPMFANQGQYEKMIESDIDIDDATDRVVKAYDRVISDVPTRNAFRQFYGTVTDSDIVSALLDPTQQIPALEKKVMAAEIGGQALRQGLTASLTAGEPVKTAYTNVQRGTLGAQELAAQGVTEEQAARDYEIIAEQLPTAEKLSSIYANRAEQVSQKELEQAEILGLESAKRKQRRLAGMERATFGGESGVSQTSLGRRGTAGAF